MFTLIFSKDRPMQLDLLLRTLPALSTPPTVLYKSTTPDDPTAAAFADRCVLRKESDFYDDTIQVLRSIREPFTMVLTDDTVFLTPCDVSAACSALGDRAGALVFSLRLGRNTTWCYMLDVSQNAYFCSHANGSVLEWPIASASGDFAYPFDLSSSIYRTADLVRWVGMVGRFRNPNELEALMSRVPVSSASTMLSFARSVAVSVPLNVTQELWTNKHGGDRWTSVATLLLRWKLGWRFVIPDSKTKTSSAHECIQLSQERRK
jgi:hypothetical protein